MSESAVLCEGYHDRAFWAGWLVSLGCTDEGFRPGTTGFPRPDPWGDEVRGGEFGYHSNSYAFIRIVSCGGKSQVLPRAGRRLNNRARKPLIRLIISVDPDVNVAGPGAATGLRRQDVLQFVQHYDPAASISGTGEIEIDGGATKISLARWEAADPAPPALPDQQTLERLACSSIVAAYPARGDAVRDWLAARPLPPPADPKAHAWSYMAGWYAQHGCEFFYSHLWNDPLVARELESRLRPSGAWQVAEALAL